jgi:hypothetical protein
MGRRRARVRARTGCVGCSIPLLIGLAVIAALAVAACSAAAPSATAPPKAAGTATSAPVATATAAGAAPGCATATATVTAITKAGGIDLTTGSMRSSVSADEAAGWASSLGAAALKVGAGRLGADLISAQAAATDLSLSVTNGNATRLIAALQKAIGNCPATTPAPAAISVPAATTRAVPSTSAPAAAAPGTAPAAGGGAPTGPEKITVISCGRLTAAQQDQYETNATAGLLYRFTNASANIVAAPKLEVNFLEGSTVVGDNVTGEPDPVGAGQSGTGEVDAIGGPGTFDSCEIMGYYLVTSSGPLPTLYAG